ncbi:MULTISPECIES: methyltransferase family protein [Rhodococcus]|uniref:methyltransferase family protein n=1 Tax=Rhodococcus TaxID=1827 RepID=UPI00121E267D|nr:MULTISPECIES: isoprenylcysteine carboxylmethyltransferase family protein [Rhodococcus]MCE4263874.1 isoprenylcysteine carboxylmethyltransferase family protein [Rhodococcus globerulus]QXW03514.1 isoprenylcysteine carboxylmethyltransferase family protein [Rhodococcus globerulus]RZL24186.1 MAG: isoprenylcysteine carboxylmethyltransferase family protein [Rhodococcus sp. (in: high G+C Gram-positive bacteria)]
MAVTALVFYALFGILGFGWRSAMQYQRTGSTGFRGVTGRLGSLEWIAGTGFVVAIALGVVAPALQLAAVLHPIGVLIAPAVQTMAIVLALAGIVGTLYAQNQMGESWRIGVDPTETTDLVRTGVFGLVRNPIFTAMLVFAAGITLLTPNPLALIGFALLLATIELQVRVVEEPYLRDRHGDTYRTYSRTVGRFVPRVGLT